MVHSLRTSQRRLPPLQTGRADFPHPAYPRARRSEACVERDRLGRRAETLPRNEVGRSLFWEQCSMCILTLLHVESLAGPLRSAGITPLQRYYEPLRLPIEPRRSYGFPRLVDPWPTCQASLDRVSQVPGDSVGIRCPLPPRRARPLQAFVASRSVTGFTLSGRAGHLKCVTRPNRVHACALRLTPLPSKAPTAGSLRQPLGRLHGERTTTMVSTFQLTRTVKLCLTHQMSPI